MTPEFAKVVDPIFLHVLKLLDDIEENRREEAGQPSWEEEQIRIRALLDTAEAAMGQREDWMLAKYALICWIDDVLIDAPWPGRQWWFENPLEVMYYGVRMAWSRFYERADEAMRMPKRDALEVYYVCAVLGFRGMYRDDPENPPLPQFPPNLETWAKQVATSIRLGLGRPPIHESPRPSQGAPPLEGKFRLVGASLIAVCLTALALILGGLMVGDLLNPPAADESGTLETSEV